MTDEVTGEAVPAPFLSDDDLAITCIADEAANQPHAGKVMVGCIILNRLKRSYSSDGTMIGTVLHRWAFSGFWAQMVHGKYTQTQFNLQQAEAEATRLHSQFSANTSLWSDCQLAWKDARAWEVGSPMSFVPGPQFSKLDEHAVLYYNPAVVPTPPAWATHDKLEAIIYAEWVYRD